MKTLLLIFLLICSINSYSNNINGQIDGSVNVITKQHVIEVSLRYRLIRADIAISQARFLLSSEACIKNIEGNDVKRYYMDTTTRPEPTVVIDFKERLYGRDVDINFEYSIGYNVSQYTQYGFIELGLDWFWFPVHPKVNEWNLKYSLMVKTDDDSLKLFSNGDVKRITSREYEVRSLYPDFDIDLFFLKGSRVFSANNGDIQVIGNANNPLLKDSIAKVTAKYLSFYKEKFGYMTSKVTAVFRPELNDPNAFGYSRKGYFVLQEQKTLDGIKLYIAHELAHFWFLTGERTENAWLTESFAEFSAMLAMKRFHGDSAYQLIIKDKISRLDRFKKDGKVIPAVYKNGSKNKNMWSQVALYHKGPLILDQLMKFIGEDKLISLMRLVFEKRIKTSDEFIEVVGTEVSPDAKEKARNLITTF